MSDCREFSESPFGQGESEAIAYSFAVTSWCSTPTSVSVAIYTMPNYTDVSSTKLLGSASVSGDTITLPQVYGLVVDTIYRLEVSWVGDDGNTYEVFALIVGMR